MRGHRNAEQRAGEEWLTAAPSPQAGGRQRHAERVGRHQRDEHQQRARRQHGGIGHVARPARCREEDRRHHQRRGHVGPEAEVPPGLVQHAPVGHQSPRSAGHHGPGGCRVVEGRGVAGGGEEAEAGLEVADPVERRQVGEAAVPELVRAVPSLATQ